MSEVLKTGAEIAKNPGAAVDVVKTGVKVVKTGVRILPNPKDFKDLSKLVQAASSGKCGERDKEGTTMCVFCGFVSYHPTSI